MLSDTTQLGEDLIFDMIHERHFEIAGKIEEETGEEPSSTDPRFGISFEEMRTIPLLTPQRLQAILDRLLAAKSIVRLSNGKYGLPEEWF